MSVHIQTLKAQKDSQNIPLVMLHGWGRTSADFLELGKSLSDDRDILLVDLPGFGRSPLPAPHFGVEEYAAEIVRALALPETGVTRFHLCGHSVGGKISSVIAANYPDAVERLVLLDASGLPRHRSASEKLKIASISFLRKSIRRIDSLASTNIYQNWFIPRFASPDYKNAGPLKNIFVKIVNQTVAPFLPKIRCPVLLIWGAKDTETPVDVGQSFEKAIPGAKLIVLPGMGHSPHTEGGASILEFHLAKFLTA